MTFKASARKQFHLILDGTISTSATPVHRLRQLLIREYSFEGLQACGIGLLLEAVWGGRVQGGSACLSSTLCCCAFFSWLSSSGIGGGRLSHVSVIKQNPSLTHPDCVFAFLEPKAEARHCSSVTDRNLLGDSLKVGCALCALLLRSWLACVTRRRRVTNEIERRRRRRQASCAQPDLSHIPQR